MTPWTVACQPHLSMGILQARIMEWVAMPSSGDLPSIGIKPRSPALQEHYLPSELPGKPKKTGMGSLSLLQGKFLTQESNWGLLYCSRILYSVNQVRSVQFSSVAQSCLTLCDPMNHSMPGLPVHHQLPESTQTHVHRVGDAIQPSHPLLYPSPPALNLSQHQGLFQ